MSKQSNQRYRKEIEKENSVNVNKQESSSGSSVGGKNDRNKINREFTDTTDNMNH